MTMGNVDPRQFVRKKFRGELVLTAELLTQLLTLPEGVNVRAMKLSDDNFKRETISVLLESDHETDVTLPIQEGCMTPNVPYEAVVQEEVKTVVTVRRVKI